MSMNLLEFVREDDFIEFFLFPTINSNNINEEEILNCLLNDVHVIAGDYCKNYIWHKDNFTLTPRYSNANLLKDVDDISKTSVLPPHLYGVIHYGENIQDEWFLVSLIYQLTEKIDGLIGRVIDSDGEFLLIEAAQCLPNWANPDTCDQRVYIYNGHLQIVQNLPSNTSNVLHVSEAIYKIKENPTMYRVSSDIQKCITERISNFPKEINDTLHNATVYVPIGVAALLKVKPHLISAAVRAFCNRDTIDMKICRAMRYFAPENRVYTNVVFTKCLYAMLMHSSYIPDKRTGWNLPLANNAEYKASLLGIKLACGFEILISQGKPTQDLEASKDWQKYNNKLKQNGYFRDLLEGSNEHTKLLDTAKAYYNENISNIKPNQIIGAEVESLLKELDLSTDEYTDLDSNLKASDSDDWLNISPEDLDDLLQKRYGIKNINMVKENINKLTENITEFLDYKSEFDGAVCPNDNTLANQPPIKPKRGVKVNKLNVVPSKTQQTNDNSVDFDADAFTSQVKNLLDLIIPEDTWDSNSEMSDYEDEDDMNKNIEDMPDSKNVKTDLKKYMDQMDQELAKTTIGQSFEVKKKESEDGFDDIESFEPVDIDMNTLKNMVESYQSQLGGPGPASNLLNSIGIGMQLNDVDKK